MKNSKLFNFGCALSIATIISSAYATLAHSQILESGKNTPLVFDPQTKKYFIGGSSKFSLKQDERGGLIDRIELSVDGGEYRPYGESVQFKEEGKHTLKFRAVNPVNNWSPVQFVEVFVDLTPPSIEAKFSEDKYYKDETNMMYVALNSTVTLVAQDNLSGVASIEYSWDGQNFNPYTKAITIPKSGQQTLFYRTTDRVGNTNMVQKLNLLADNQAPSSVIRLQGQVKPTIINGVRYVSDSVAFAIEASDDLSKVKQIWVSLDRKAPTPYLKPIYFLEEGPHTISYYSVDNVGNKEEPKTLSIHTVSTPPNTLATTVGKVVNTGGINYVTRDFQLKLEATENLVGLDRIEVKTDQDPEFRPYMEPIRFKTPGIHTVFYRSIDRAGNMEPTKTYTVNIHEVAPETTIATAQPLVIRDGVTYSPAPNVITFNVGNSSVGVDKILVSINDEVFVPYQGPITLTSDRKVYKISYKSVDKLGNEELPKTVAYQMISAVPIVELFITNGKSSEEQVRTNYLEQTPHREESGSRGLASPSMKSKKHK